MVYQPKSYQIEALFSTVNSGSPSQQSSESRTRCLQLTTHRPTAKLNNYIKHWNSTFDASLITSKTIRLSISLQQNLPTTAQSMLLLASHHLTWCTATIHPRSMSLIPLNAGSRKRH